MGVPYTNSSPSLLDSESDPDVHDASAGESSSDSSRGELAGIKSFRLMAFSGPPFRG